MTGITLYNLADRVLNRPLLIHPTKMEVVLHILEGRLPLGEMSLDTLAPDASRFAATKMSKSGLSMMDGGVAIISVIGSLVNRGAWIGAYSGVTSYEGLAKQMGDAAADPAVKAIILDLDSPGGEATGMFTLAAKVAEVAKEKRVVAVVNDMAASAAYGIASQATEIVVSPTSVVGSIGVVLTHLDRSGELQSKGIKPTLIYAGSHKVDGHPFGPLSDAVKADLQMEVAKFYDQFVKLVAQGRGDRLTEQHARATEARVFIGQEAIDRGLADRMASFDAVLASLQGKPARPSGNPTKGNKAMSGENHITQEAQAAAEAARVAESWSRAIAGINKSRGLAPVEPSSGGTVSGVSSAWAKAVRSANASIGAASSHQLEQDANSPKTGVAAMWGRAVSEANDWMRKTGGTGRA